MTSQRSFKGLSWDLSNASFFRLTSLCDSPPAIDRRMLSGHPAVVEVPVAEVSTPEVPAAEVQTTEVPLTDTPLESAVESEAPSSSEQA